MGSGILKNITKDLKNEVLALTSESITNLCYSRGSTNCSLVFNITERVKAPTVMDLVPGGVVWSKMNSTLNVPEAIVRSIMEVSSKNEVAVARKL